MVMTIQKRVDRFKANYEILNRLYKLGRFEDEVAVTGEEGNLEVFFCVSAQEISGLSSSPQSKKGGRDAQPSGRRRNAQDLEWAATCLRAQALDLFQLRNDQPELSAAVHRDIILYYFRSLSLSYEVSDYFLEVTKDLSDLLIKITVNVTRDIEKYLKKFVGLFDPDSAQRRELVKNILIAALCGVNELYRKHRYAEGLERLKILKKLIWELPEGRGHWFGLKGLCAFVEGKLFIAVGSSHDAENSFRRSVELYSESVAWKERDFSLSREKFRAAARNSSEPLERESLTEEYLRRQNTHQLSRGVALRRSGLACSFGYAFQTLVMGKVREAIHLSALARGIVSVNTGELHRAYVDLIYYSAKRAENSSNRDELIEIKKNLQRCYRVFNDLVPASHYKNKALFQLAIAYHYLARSYYTQGDRKRARKYWLRAEDRLNITILDKKIGINKRLRAESMAILGHVQSNLALVARDLGHDGMHFIDKAEAMLNEAWSEAEQHFHIQCEVGLAQAAVGKAKAEYLRKTRPGDTDSEDSEVYKGSLSNARAVLHKVLILNSGYSGRVQATAFLRLTEIALMEEGTRFQARGYFDEYLKISTQVEHEFCRQWAYALKKQLGELDKLYTFTIEPGKQEADKAVLDDILETFYVKYTLSTAAMEIEAALAEKASSRASISAYISRAFTKNFRIVPSTARKWIEKHNMIDRIIKICPGARDLPHYAPQSNRSQADDSGIENVQ